MNAELQLQAKFVDDLNKWFEEFKNVLNQFEDDWKQKITQEIMIVKLLNSNPKLDILINNIYTSIAHIREIDRFICALPMNSYFIYETFAPQPLRVDLTFPIQELYTLITDILELIYHLPNK